MLHDSMNLLGLWSMSSKWRKVGRGRMIGQGTSQGKLRRIFQRRVVHKLGIISGLRGLSHQGESSSFKGFYDRDSEPRVKTNIEIDTP